MKKKNKAFREEIIYTELTEKMTDEEIRSMEETKNNLFEMDCFRIYLKNYDSTGLMFQIPNKYDYNEMEDYFITQGYKVYERHNLKGKNIVAFLTEYDQVAVMDYMFNLGMFGTDIFPFEENEVKIYRMDMAER